MASKTLLKIIFLIVMGQLVAHFSAWVAGIYSETREPNAALFVTILVSSTLLAGVLFGMMFKEDEDD